MSDQHGDGATPLERYLERVPPEELALRRAFGEMPGPVFHAETGPTIRALADEVLGNGTGLTLGDRVDAIGEKLDEHVAAGRRGRLRRIVEVRLVDILRPLLAVLAGIVGKGALS